MTKRVPEIALTEGKCRDCGRWKMVGKSGLCIACAMKRMPRPCFE